MKSLNLLRASCSLNPISQRALFTQNGFYSSEHKKNAAKIVNILKFQEESSKGKLEYIFSDKKLLSSIDNTHNFDFEHNALDSLARLLSFQDPCTAVFLKDNILSISYNTNHGNRLANQTPSRSNFLFLKDRIKSLTDEACKHLGDITSYQNKATLLNLALMHSTSYHPALQKLKYHSLNLPTDINDKTLTALDSFFGEITPYKIPYSDSDYLDNLNDEKRAKLQDIKYNKKLMTYYLDLLKLILPNETNHPNNQKTILYETVLPFLSDVTKAVKLVNDKQINKLDVDLLSNDYNLHCEVNILHQLNLKNDETKTYIGISKLCCFFCGVIMTASDVPHSGRHGLLYIYDVEHLFDQKEKYSSELISTMKTIILEKHFVFQDHLDINNEEQIVEQFINLDINILRDIFNHESFKKNDHSDTQLADYRFESNLEIEMNGLLDALDIHNTEI